MQRIYSSEVPKHSGKMVLVAGWVSDIRDLGGLKFFVMRDKAGIVQITMPKKSVAKDVLAVADDVSKESVIQVEGEVKEAKQAPGGFEVVPEKLLLLSKAASPVPIDLSGKIESDLSKRLDYRFLDLRPEKRRAIFRIRSKMFKFCTEFFDREGFTIIQTPKLTVAGVESGAELFPVVYFEREAFLSQSPQIYKQMMVAAGFERVFEIGPVFRAEKSHTTRHLTEFTGVDFEMGFISGPDDVMDMIEAMVQHIIKRLNEECKQELQMWGIDVKVPKKIPRITMVEAKKLLAAKGKKLSAEDDLDAEGEKQLGEIVKEKFKEEFVFVTLYPARKRPFYHMMPANDKSVTLSYDLIWNGVEIATGSQREHRYEILKKQAAEKGVDLDGMRDYANIFKYGCPPHGGVGLGLDRMVEQLLKLDNIREAILLTRDTERLTP